MNSHQLSFNVYLRGEVDNAEKVFQQAKDRVFSMTSGPEIEVSPKLLAAVEILSESMKLYMNALRRMAHYSAHHSRQRANGQVVQLA
ncbi:MAG TPA: hypothetical protein VGL72_01815 [Bryobacteraceae bacterium]|jgi:hypothetical protein